MATVRIVSWKTFITITISSKTEMKECKKGQMNGKSYNLFSSNWSGSDGETRMVETTKISHLDLKDVFNAFAILKLSR